METIPEENEQSSSISCSEDNNNHSLNNSYDIITIPTTITKKQKKIISIGKQLRLTTHQINIINDLVDVHREQQDILTTVYNKINTCDITELSSLIQLQQPIDLITTPSLINNKDDLLIHLMNITIDDLYFILKCFKNIFSNLKTNNNVNEDYFESNSSIEKINNDFVEIWQHVMTLTTDMFIEKKLNQKISAKVLCAQYNDERYIIGNLCFLMYFSLLEKKNIEKNYIKLIVERLLYQMPAKIYSIFILNFTSLLEYAIIDITEYNEQVIGNIFNIMYNMIDNSFYNNTKFTEHEKSAWEENKVTLMQILLPYVNNIQSSKEPCEEELKKKRDIDELLDKNSITNKPIIEDEPPSDSFKDLSNIYMEMQDIIYQIEQNNMYIFKNVNINTKHIEPIINETDYSKIMLNLYIINNDDVIFFINKFNEYLSKIIIKENELETDFIEYYNEEKHWSDNKSHVLFNQILISIAMDYIEYKYPEANIDKSTYYKDNMGQIYILQNICALMYLSFIEKKVIKAILAQNIINRLLYSIPMVGSAFVLSYCNVSQSAIIQHNCNIKSILKCLFLILDPLEQNFENKDSYCLYENTTDDWGYRKSQVHTIPDNTKVYWHCNKKKLIPILKTFINDHKKLI